MRNLLIQFEFFKIKFYFEKIKQLNIQKDKSNFFESTKYIL